MQLEDYFNFLGPLDIRVKGTRIGIETILWDYLDRGRFAEEITAHYRSLTLEQVYATLTYYWHNKEQVDAYLHAVEDELARQREEQERNPPPGIVRLRAMLEARANASREP
jgi:uncharacterized protein (DUF433 family)